MQLCICFLLVKIFALTNSLSPIKQRINGRRFNPALEPVIDYSNEDAKNLNNGHDFITTATGAEQKVITFTDFILETITILNTYEDTAFEDFLHIFDIEIRKYHYGGCKFFELMQNHNTRTLLVRTLKTIRENSIIFTKANINEIADMLRDKIYNKHVKEILDYINSLYRNNEPEFQTVLNNLKQYTKTKSETHEDLEQVITNGVRTILFNHYTELDTHTRRELKERIETFWENLKNSPDSNSKLDHSQNTAPVSKLISNNIKISEKIKSKVNEHDIVFTVDPRTKLLDQKKKIVSTVSSDEQSQDKELEKDESSIEIGSQATDYIAEEQSSGQSFASSSNSIKQSQERYEKYITARYNTLYTEEISYKARTTKKTEIIPISKKVITRRPTVPKRPKNIPRYSPRDVTLDRKKKMKKQRINHDTSDLKQHISPDSSYETENGQTLKLKTELRARVPSESSDKQAHAVDIPAVLRSQYDAIIAVQIANNELLKSLKMLAPVGMDTKSDTTLYQKSVGHNKLEPMKHKVPVPFMRVQEKIEPKKTNDNIKSPSRYSKRKGYFDRKEPNEPMRRLESTKNKKEILIEKALNDNKQTRKSVRLNDNTKVIDFNEFVNLKITSIKNELTELKQVNDVVTRQANNNTDEVGVTNATDYDQIRDTDENIRKSIKKNVIELLKRDREINHAKVNDEKISEDVNDEEISEEINYGNIYNTRSNTIKAVSTTNTNTPSVAKVVYRPMDIVNNTTSQTTVTNVTITKTAIDELNGAVRTDSVTTNSTVAERIIRNPFDHLDVKFPK